MSRDFRSPYPGYDVRDQWNTPSTDDITRRVLQRRLHEVPARTFFTQAEWDICEAICDTVMPQDDRAQPVPITPWLDAALAQGRTTGTRYADMPAQPDAWRQGLKAIDAEAHARHGEGFAALSARDRDALLRAVDAQDVDPALWNGLPPQRFFRMALLKDIVAVYYVHPAAQSEVGFGGPANPRGYVRLGADQFDAWEAPAGAWRTGRPE